MPTIEEAFALAVQQYQADDLTTSEYVCRQILAVQSQHAGAMFVLGVITHRTGRHEEAFEFVRQSLVLQPNNSQASYTLGSVLRSLHRGDEAVRAYQAAIQGNPADPEFHLQLGTLLMELGRSNEAITSLRRVVELKPDHASAHFHLGRLLLSQAKSGEAITAFQRAISCSLETAVVYCELGIAFARQGRYQEAVIAYGKALELQPDSFAAYCNLGSAYLAINSIEEAIAATRRAIEIDPSHWETHNNLGGLHKLEGNMEQSLACYRQAMELSATNTQAHHNYLYALVFSPGHDGPEIGKAHRTWAERFADPLAVEIQTHSNELSPQRRLRIGYVSPDFRKHPITNYMLPILENHNHEQFEIYCYASVRATDGTVDVATERCRRASDVWRDVLGLSDEQLAAKIREDKIDILVDLSMHMAQNRLLVFARKPAPVQVTYLAYPGTTGLRTMDYRFTDPYLDPPEFDDGRYSEASFRLPGIAGCYSPPIDAPAVNPPPASERGFITFGCLNNFCKVSQATLATWAEVLHRVPTSRMLLHAAHGSHRNRVQRTMEQCGIDPSRFDFVAMLPIEYYFAQYRQIDIALDPYPYNGSTTTFDSLWMGVPVISLAGQTSVGRQGLSILSNLELTDLVAHNESEYIQIASELAGDLPRLTHLRSTMRERMLRSALMDARQFTRNIEAAYRQIWQRYCTY